MSPEEREALTTLVAGFCRAGGSPSLEEWGQLSPEERAVFVAVREEQASPRAFPFLDRETSDAYERVLGVMGVPRG